jgi:hypothetical protein
MTLQTGSPRRLSTVLVLSVCALVCVFKGVASAQTNGQFSACGGVQTATLKSAFRLIQSEVCNELNLIVTGVHSGNNIGPDIVTLYNDLQTQLSLTPLCAASLMAVFAQEVINHEVSAAACPAEN